MILTFICTSTTGSATKLEALEYQLGSSSYTKGKYKKINYPSFYTTLQENGPKKSELHGPPIFSQRDA